MTWSRWTFVALLSVACSFGCVDPAAPDDSGTPVDDSGTPTEDAGAAGNDAGPPPLDGGAFDAGAAVDDAGPTPADDAGAAPNDAGRVGGDDGGTSVADAGGAPDAGVVDDAGSTAVDAGTPFDGGVDGGVDVGVVDPDVRNYIFGHSLLWHSDVANVPRWLQAFSDAAGGRSYAMSGQYGFADTHAANLPPIAQWGLAGASIWDDDSPLTFGEVDFNVVLFTEANFRQYYPPTQPDPDGFLPESTVASTTTVFDWVDNAEPGMRFVIYENWPDMASYTSADFTTTYPTPQEMAAYHAFTAGAFHDWWLAYHDAMLAERPAMDIQLVPVGSTLAQLLTTTLADVPVEALYEDDAPHGRETLYFLAGIVTYCAIHGVPPPVAFAPGDEIHPLVRERYDAIVDEVWLHLLAFDDANGVNRALPTP